MVPMHGRKAAGAFHEPDPLIPSFSLRYGCGEVGTARCAVHAAFSGDSTVRDRLLGQHVPPAARGRGRRSAAVPTDTCSTPEHYTHDSTLR